MSISLSRTVMATALAVLLVAPAYAQQETTLTGTRLDLSAQAQVKAQPDTATIVASVVTKGATAQAAREENAQLMQAAFQVLKDKKIAEKDMQTSGLTINPDYVYAEKQPPKISGYQVVNTLTVTLHDMAKSGDVIDALIKSGINQFSGPTFSIGEPETYLNKARQEAMQKAKARADVYAQATGLKIKRIVSINENTNMGNPIPYRMMAKAAMVPEAADTATPMATGEVTLDVTVNVTYELQ